MCFRCFGVRDARAREAGLLYATGCAFMRGYETEEGMAGVRMGRSRNYVATCGQTRDLMLCGCGLERAKCAVGCGEGCECSAGMG